MRRFVITGCGRSGTTYTTAVLKKLGIRVEHEVFLSKIKPKKFGFFLHRPSRTLYFRTIDWENDLQGEIAWQAAPLLSRLPRDIITFHQIRHPLKFVRSRLKKGLVDVKLRHQHVPVPGRALTKDQFEQLPLQERINYLCRFWIKWNELAEQIIPAERRYRVEDLDRHFFYKICEDIEYPVTLEAIDTAIDAVPKNKNTKTGLQDYDVKLEDLPTDLGSRLENKAQQYGYSLHI